MVPRPRLEVVCDSAEHIEKYLKGAKADVVVCALPFTSLDAGLRRRLLDGLPSMLAPTGTAVVIQYSPLIQGELRKRFPSVQRRISPRNIRRPSCSPAATRRTRADLRREARRIRAASSPARTAPPR